VSVDATLIARFADGTSIGVVGARSSWTLFRRSDRYTQNLAMKDHVCTHKTLDLEDRVATVQPDSLAHEHQSVSGPDLAAKSNVFHASEANESRLEETDTLAVVA
jgi:hypothetical protein